MFARGPLSFFLRRTFAVVVVLLLCGPSGECCGPGRRGGRRRSPRKLTPLVFKEHVPNVAETTLGASGLTEGHITLDDPRFHELVPNYNSDIYYRDEEGTGVDRLMTERCRERLNMLTISVMNTWANVRLRVIEGWESGRRHQQNSLHYEGRAVDISTSDKDRSKLGMLARLAVEAGFDWVFYESRSHVHCSVKSESSSRRRLGGCFPADAQVKTPNGLVSIDILKEGDFVQVLKQDGSLDYSPLLLFLHKDADESRSFLQLGTSSGKKLTLTPSHLVFIVRKELYFEGLQHDILSQAEAVLAGSVQPGDYLLTTVNNSIVLDKVISFDASWSSGVFAPLTRDGTVVVNSVVASCYAVIDSQRLAHLAFLPVRLYYRVKDIVLSIIPTLATTSDLNKYTTILYYDQKYKVSSNSIKMNSIDPINKYDIHDNSLYKYKKYTNKEINSVKSHRKGKLFPRIIKDYRKSLNFSKTNRESITNDSVIIEAAMNKSHHQAYIHWYAKFLYDIAYWLLPNHLVYA